MNLDRSTYEAWLLDRIEGTLTSEQEHKLDAFLAANPDLPAVISELPHVDGGNEVFPVKRNLHRDLPPKGAPDAARLDDFLVARLEGGLSAKQEKELDRYLYEHPEVARDASLMPLTKLAGEAIHFDGKAGIARHFPPHGLPDANRLTDFLIAKVEGDLSLDQLDALALYLREHPAAKREQQLIAATFVKNEALTYPEKNALKKRAVRVVPLWPRLAAAASIALLLSAGWWLLREERPVEDAGIAQVEQAVQREADGHTQPEQNVPEVQSRTSRPEAAGSRRNDAEVKVKAGTATKPQNGHSSPKDQSSRERSQHPLPLLKSIQRITRASIGEQALAQAAVGENEWTIAQAPVATPAPGEIVSPAVEGENLGTFLANKMRSDVLDTPRRAEALDGTDALAVADRTIAKITGGQGGVDVQRSSTRDRFLLRLGRNFSLSASRGR